MHLHKFTAVNDLRFEDKDKDLHQPGNMLLVAVNKIVASMLLVCCWIQRDACCRDTSNMLPATSTCKLVLEDKGLSSRTTKLDGHVNNLVHDSAVSLTFVSTIFS